MCKQIKEDSSKNRNYFLVGGTVNYSQSEYMKKQYFNVLVMADFQSEFLKK